MATVTLRLTPKRAHVRTARLVATAMARRSGVPEELLDEVRLAVGEACGRAVQLYERYGLTESIVVTLADDDHRFRVVVRDLAPSKPGDDDAGSPLGSPGAPSVGPGLRPDPVPRVDHAGQADQPPLQHAGAPSGESTGHPQAAGPDIGWDGTEVPDWQTPLDMELGLALLHALVEDISVEKADGMVGTEVRMSWSLEPPADRPGRLDGPPAPQPD